jgi:hypothetical protein
MDIALQQENIDKHQSFARKQLDGVALASRLCSRPCGNRPNAEGMDLEEAGAA